MNKYQAHHHHHYTNRSREREKKIILYMCTKRERKRNRFVHIFFSCMPFRIKLHTREKFPSENCFVSFFILHIQLTHIHTDLHTHENKTTRNCTSRLFFLCHSNKSNLLSLSPAHQNTFRSDETSILLCLLTKTNHTHRHKHKKHKLKILF